MIIINFLILGLTWAVILSSAPYQTLLDFLKRKLRYNQLETTKRNISLIQGLSCALCTGTWVGITYAILTCSNPILIGLTAVAAELTYRKLNTI
mgnify:CR=1 FL=1